MFQGPCLIIAAGPTVSGPIEIKLRPVDGSFAQTFFLSSANVAREVLATALVAMTSNIPVWCEIDDPTQAYTELKRFVLER